MKSEIFKFLLLGLAVIQITSAQNHRVMCYYASWNFEAFAPEDIDVNICTHINYAFVGLLDDGSLRFDETDILQRISALKSRNPNLKAIFSVGGWNEGSVIFSNIARDANKKARLAQSALDSLQQFNYDGIDIDWEFPAQLGGIPEDKQNFVDLLRVLRDALSPRGYLVSTAVTNYVEATSYDVPAISAVVDVINIMAYDYHQDMTKAGQNAPLYASSTDSDWERGNANLNATIRRWVESGAEPSKAGLGLAFYGHTFQLADPNNNNVGAPVVGPGINGGSLGYRDICLLGESWIDHWDDEQKVPFKTSGDQWLGYDNHRSILEKINFAKSLGFGGVMVWTINFDDRDDVCGDNLIQAIQSGFNG